MGSMQVRALAAVVALAGCGRFGFDRPPPPSADAVAPPRSCTSDADCGPCQACVSDTCATAVITDLYAGHRSTCFLGEGGSRWCVGEDTGGTPTALFPTRIPGEDGWTKLYLGYQTNFGDRGGALWSFGAGTPVDVGPDIYEVATEIASACLRGADGSLTCDGKVILGTWSTIDAGINHFCGVQAGGVFCWGEEQGNALGQGVEPDGTQIPNPTRVGTDADWVDVEIGASLSCGRKADNAVFCWGGPNETGTNGVDTMGVPTQISPRQDWQSVHVRWNHACGQHFDGSIDCWGWDEYGLEVLPGQTLVAVPTPLGMTFDAFEMGGHHYCGQTGGQWYCWGWNAAGQLAIGSTTSHQMPTVPVCTRGS